MLVTNTIYGSYQYLQYNKIEPRNGRPVTDAYVLMNKDVAMLRIRTASYIGQGHGHRGSGVVSYKGTRLSV